MTSMTLTTPVQISSSSTEESSADKVTCRMCRKQFAKYTCPKCNVPYCSLTCFRSQAHNQCSEGFYKKEIELDIHSGPSKTAKERQQMIELLKNFEEDASVQQTSSWDEGEEVNDSQQDLIQRLGSINLESTSPDTLWTMLTSSERSKFMKVFNNPTSELARQLLSNEQLEKEILQPWWEAPAIGEDPLPHRDDRPGPPYGDRPTFMDLPESMVKPFPLGHPLVYNMCAICISYAYITRYLGTSPLSTLKRENPDYYEARRLVTQTVPFLTDRKSTMVYPNLTAVVTDIWSKFDLGVMTGDLFALILRDSAHLLKPLRITQMVSTGPPTSTTKFLPTHPHSTTILVLSDLYALFSNACQDESSQDNPMRFKHNPVTHKLLFYAAHIVATPSVVLDSLANEMSVRAEGYRSREKIGGLDDRRGGANTGKRLGSQGLVKEIQ